MADDRMDCPDVRVRQGSDFEIDVLNRRWDHCSQCTLLLLGAADMRLGEPQGLAAAIGNSGIAAGTWTFDCRSQEESTRRRCLEQRHTGYDLVVSMHLECWAPGFQTRAEERLTELWGRPECCLARNYDRCCILPQNSDAGVAWDPLLGPHSG